MGFPYEFPISLINEITVNSSVAVGILSPATRVSALQRASAVLVGVLVDNSARVAQIIRLSLNPIGINTTAAKLASVLRAGVALSGIQSVAARVKSVARTSATAIGLQLQNTVAQFPYTFPFDFYTSALGGTYREVYLTRTAQIISGITVTATRTAGFISVIIVGVAITASRLSMFIRTAASQIGASVAASRLVVRARMAVTQIGALITASRLRTLVRTASVTIGAVVSAVYTFITKFFTRSTIGFEQALQTTADSEQVHLTSAGFEDTLDSVVRFDAGG